MLFKERTLTPYSHPTSTSDLKEGLVYFAVNYVDEELLIPTMEALVYIGRDLDPDDPGQMYFQDIESHRRGVRYQTSEDHDCARFYSGTEVHHIVDYEQALEELLRCSLRRSRR